MNLDWLKENTSDNFVFALIFLINILKNSLISMLRRRVVEETGRSNSRFTKTGGDSMVKSKDFTMVLKTLGEA